MGLIAAIFFPSLNKKKGDKKQEVLDRVKKVQVIQAAIEIHKKNRDEAYISKGGFSKPANEGLNEDIVSKLGAMRKRLGGGKTTLHAKGRNFFKSR